MKVVWLQPVWSHYHLSRARSFQDANPDIDLICLEISDMEGQVSVGIRWRVDASLGLRREVLFPGIPYKSIAPFSITQSVLKFLRTQNADVLCLLGYARPEIQQIALLLSLNPFRKKVRLVLLSESKKDDFSRRPWVELSKSLLLRCYDSALVGGKCHQQYLTDLGMTAKSVFSGYDVVNNRTFHPSQIGSLNPPYKKPYFLAISRFVKKKNLSFLVKAYADYRTQKILNGEDAWNLVICGDGELRGELEKEIGIHRLNEFVCLPGFLSQHELLPFLAHACCFVHASIQEQWGLVVNEAISAGLPVLVSNRCGCFGDLVIEGINGFGFNPFNQQQLEALMLKVNSDLVNLNAMGKASLIHSQKYSPAYFAQGLKQAVDYAVSQR